MSPDWSQSTNLISLHLGISEAGVQISSQALAQLSDRDLVEVDVELLLQLVEVLLLGFAYKQNPRDPWDYIDCSKTIN